MIENLEAKPYPMIFKNQCKYKRSILENLSITEIGYWLYL